MTWFQVLPMGVCKALITKGSYKFVGKNEICAGKKKSFPTVKVFEKSGESFNLAGTEKNFYGKLEDDIQMIHADDTCR